MNITSFKQALTAAESTPFAVQAAYKHLQTGCYFQARAILVIHGTLATVKDAVYHLAKAVGHLAAAILHTATNLASKQPLAHHFFSNQASKLKAYSCKNAGIHLLKSVGFALNVPFTIILGSVSPKLQIQLLDKVGLCTEPSPSKTVELASVDKKTVMGDSKSKETEVPVLVDKEAVVPVPVPVPVSVSMNKETTVGVSAKKPISSPNHATLNVSKDRQNAVKKEDLREKIGQAHSSVSQVRAKQKKRIAKENALTLKVDYAAAIKAGIGQRQPSIIAT